MIDDKPEQYWNALSPILVTELGRESDDKLEQYWNALSPILVTEFGRVIDFKPEQPEKVLLVDYQYYTL